MAATCWCTPRSSRDSSPAWAPPRRAPRAGRGARRLGEGVSHCLPADAAQAAWHPRTSPASGGFATPRSATPAPARSWVRRLDPLAPLAVRCQGQVAARTLQAGIPRSVSAPSSPSTGAAWPVVRRRLCAADLVRRLFRSTSSAAGCRRTCRCPARALALCALDRSGSDGTDTRVREPRGPAGRLHRRGRVRVGVGRGCADGARLALASATALATC